MPPRRRAGALLVSLVSLGLAALGCVASAETSEDLSRDPDESLDGVEAQSVNAAPWRSIGYGVAEKDTGNTLGNSWFIAYAGYDVSLASAERWATALYVASLRARGVRHVVAVQGPADPGYDGLEIGNSRVANALVHGVDAHTRFILVVGHSSGTFVADELFGQLDGGADPHRVTAGKIVYFDLDGGQKSLSDGVIHRLRKAYYVAARDPRTGTNSPNHDTMASLGADYPRMGGFLQYDARSAGCYGGAVWCLHVSLVTTRPHDHAGADATRDYSDFAGRPVNHFYIDAKAAEAGLHL